MTTTLSGVLGVRREEGAGPEAGDDPAVPTEPAGLAEPAAEPAEVPPEPAEVPPESAEVPAELDEVPVEPGDGDTGGSPYPGTRAGAGPDPEEPAVTAPTAGSVTDVPVGSTPLEPDAVAAAAVELARAAAARVAEGSVGEHVGVDAEPAEPGEAVVTHSFASTNPAYVGWRWCVTVVRAEGTDQVTVDEVVLLPGSGALLAPAWVPWNERLQPGDLAPGDVLPPPADDERLVPAYAEGDEASEELADLLRHELGLGRPRVLSREGRAQAAERWEEGPGGPFAPIAKAAPGRCGDCGFLVPLGGSLRAAFGACANGYAPDDGRVVALTHGCGAHSETAVELQHVSAVGMAVEDDEFEIEPVGPQAQEADPV